MSSPRKTEEELAKIKENRRVELLAEREARRNDKLEKLEVLKEALGIDSMDSARFYLIGNVSAVVVRKNGTTICALSFYNTNDGFDTENTENIGLLIPIGYTGMYNKCLHAALNYKDNKYKYQLPYIELSDLTVYKTWMYLKKMNKLPYKYMKKEMNNCIHFGGEIDIGVN